MIETSSELRVVRSAHQERLIIAMHVVLAILLALVAVSNRPAGYPGVWKVQIAFALFTLALETVFNIRALIRAMRDIRSRLADVVPLPPDAVATSALADVARMHTGFGRRGYLAQRVIPWIAVLTFGALVPLDGLFMIMCTVVAASALYVALRQAPLRLIETRWERTNTAQLFEPAYPIGPHRWYSRSITEATNTTDDA